VPGTCTSRLSAQHSPGQSLLADSGYPWASGRLLAEARSAGAQRPRSTLEKPTRQACTDGSPRQSRGTVTTLAQRLSAWYDGLDCTIFLSTD